MLPQETRNYVPIIVAVTIMAKNPAQYGLENVVPEKPVSTDQVTINYPVDLRLVAECLDTSAETLQELNPSLLRMTTPKDQTFTLNLPTGSKDKYETAIAVIPPDMRTFWRYHRVEYGESLSSIARKYHTTTSVIEEANNLDSDDVKVGSKLIIPIAPAGRATRWPIRKRRPSTKSVSGDTVGSIADDFQVPVEKVRKWNHLKGNTVATGRTLLIYKPLSDCSGPETAASGDPPAASKSGKQGQVHSSLRKLARSRRKMRRPPITRSRRAKR